VQALRAHRARQLEERLAAGPLWTDHGLVFTNRVGRPLDPCALAHRDFPRLLQRAGLPRIRFHDLRHTYATLALLNGERPKVVQETLGHSTIILPLDTYAHLLPEMQEDAVARLDRLLGLGG
jgi:integrase